MISKKQSQKYKRSNLLFLRRYLGLTQKSFIADYLADGNGDVLISASTLSNLETKGGRKLDDVIVLIASKLNIAGSVFDSPPDSFEERISSVINLSEKECVSKALKPNVETLIRQLTNYFAELIFDGSLSAGGRIDSDRVLAEKFNVSRSSIREALKVLYIIGMVDTRPSQGSFLCRDTSNFFIVPLSWSVFLSPKQTGNILELRNTIETQAAQLAASCDDTVNIDKLASISRSMRLSYESRNRQEFLEQDLLFHNQIAVCSGNPIIHNLTQTLSNLVCRLSGGGMISLEQVTKIYEEHQLIYMTIAAHDSYSAGIAMQKHLENSISRYYI